MSPAARKRATAKGATAKKAAGRPPAASRPDPARRGRGRPSAHDSEQTREAILAAAVHRFGHAGYDSVSMETIAEDCGVNVRAIYYHFASKRALFEAAADSAFTRYGHEVLQRVFVHLDTRSRVAGYVEVHRALHAREPDVLPFIGMWLVELQGRGGDDEPTDERRALGDFLEVIVDDAIARGEVNADLDRDGALMLLSVIGMGLALGSLGEQSAYPGMLDALELLNAGTLFQDGPG